MSSQSALKWALFALLSIGNYAFAAPAPNQDFDQQLEVDAVLGGLDYEEYQPVSGLKLYVQLVGGNEAERTDAASEDFGALFERVSTRFDKHFAQDRSRPKIRVVITQDPNTWRDARGEDARPTPGGADFVQGFGPNGAIITYDMAWPGTSRKTREAGLSEAFAQALLVSHAGANGEALPGAMVAGLARLLAQEDPRSLLMRGEGEGPDTMHDRLIDQLVEGGFADGFLLNEADLWSPLGMDALWQLAKERTTEAREVAQWNERHYDSLVDQAASVMAAGLDMRKVELAEWVRANLTGEATAPDFLGQATSAAWARTLGTERSANLGFEPRGLSQAGGYLAALDALALPEQTANARQAGPVFDHIAEGLYLASQGKLAAAEAALEVVASNPDAARNLAGIRALSALRTSYLEHLSDLQVSEKLRLQYDGRLLTAEVTRVGLRSVFLGDNTRDLDSLALTSINVTELVARMEKEKPTFGDSLGRAWAQALVGGKWKRSLSISQKKDKQLAADLEAVQDQLERGRILSLLSLAARPQSGSNKERLAAISELLSSASDSPDVEQAREQLQSLASEILTARFNSTDLMELLSASGAKEKGSTVTLDYDFTDTDQLSDWPLVANYSPGYVSQFSELDTKQNMHTVKDDQYVLQGDVIFQHVMAFAAPIKLTFEMSYERTKKKSDARNLTADFVLASICDDLGFQHVRTSQFGNLDIVDTETEINATQSREKPLTYKLGKPYKIEIEIDENGLATTREGGKVVFTGDSGARKDGRVLFMIHSDRIVNLERVTIVGRPAENQDALLSMWLKGQIAKLGF